MAQGSSTRNYETMVRDFIRAYNRFDVPGMLRDVDEQVVFQHRSGGKIQLTIQGKQALRVQVEEAASVFREREQKIISMVSEPNQIRVHIDFSGILAKDLPDGSRTGAPIALRGRSVFVFKKNKITRITDTTPS